MQDSLLQNDYDCGNDDYDESKDSYSVHDNYCSKETIFNMNYKPWQIDGSPANTLRIGKKYLLKAGSLKKGLMIL